jgi:HD-GYP domain-containing protein (c-di-GMP phosphodiesterase class II)
MARIPEAVLNSSRRLTAMEILDIQRHPMLTSNLLERTAGIPEVVRLIVYQTHERPDGSGYPHGRTKENIHPFARILQVADTFVALTTSRPFRAPYMPYAAVKCLLHQAQKNHVDAEVVRGMLRVLSLFPTGSYVELSDGQQALVLRANPDDFSRPLVIPVLDDQAYRDGCLTWSAEQVIDLTESPLEVTRAIAAPGSAEVSFDAKKTDSEGDLELAEFGMALPA